MANDRRIAPEQIAELHAECADELRRLALGVLRDAHLAADVVQTTFVKAIEQGHKAEESLRGWLFRVAFNEALALKRRQGVQSRALGKLAWLGDGNRSRGGLGDGGSRSGGSRGDDEPANLVCRREDSERVRAALQTLPDEQRQVVQMRLYEQKTFAVIARELKVPLGTILWRMQAALRKLRERLGPEGEE